MDEESPMIWYFSSEILLANCGELGRVNALSIRLRNVSSETGLETKSNAPHFIALMARSMLPWAVITAVGVLGQCC